MLKVWQGDARTEAQQSVQALFLLNAGIKFSLHLQKDTNIGLKYIGKRLFSKTNIHLKLKRGCDKSRFGVIIVNVVHQIIYFQLSSQAPH